MRSARAVSILLVISSLFVGVAGAQAQVRFGAKGGFQLTKMEFNAETLKKSNRIGFFMGPALNIALPVPGISIDVASLYCKNELKVQERIFNQQSLLFQGDARFSAGIGNVIGIFFKAGPQFSFNVGDDVKHWFDNERVLKEFTLQETILSVNLGAGVMIASHLECSLYYNIPISKTSDFTWHDLSEQLQDESWNHAKSRTNAWSVSATYYF